MMNQNVPHYWNLEDDPTRLAFPRKPNWLEEGGELVELLRQDGHLVTQSQDGELNPVEEHHQQCEQSLASFGNLIGDVDETESLFQYPLGDPLLEKDFAAEFFSEMAGIDVIRSAVATPSAPHQSTPSASHLHEKKKPPPPPPPPPELKSSYYFSMSSFGSLGAKMRGKGSGSWSTVGGSSMETIGSSICGSSQIPVAGERKEDSSIWLPSESKRKGSNEASSDCSFRSTGVQGEIDQNRKRKRRDMHDLEFQSEAEYEPTEGKKPAQRCTSSHRSRAAEVHNLSERRRRDRINEKMKALQELIPHCNKADKASMLEEAIEYLKSLQLQVQMMWMGRGMAQVMFPGVQQFVSGTSPLMHHAVNIPSFVGPSSSTNQTQLCPSEALNAVNFQSQTPSFHLQGTYAPYFDFHHLQPHFQAMNASTPPSNSVQQNQSTAAPSSSILPCSAQAYRENVNSKSG